MRLERACPGCVPFLLSLEKTAGRGIDLSETILRRLKPKITMRQPPTREMMLRASRKESIEPTM
jgi:hypothetical protein